MNWLFCDININETLAFSPDGIDWHTDWWKILIIAFAALLYVALLVRFSLYILRLIGVLVCVGIGVLGAFVAKSLFTDYFAEGLPVSLAQYSPVVAALLGFLLCFGISTLVMTLIRKAAQPQKSPDAK